METENKEKTIYEIKNYVDEEGRNVIAQCSIEGSSGEDTVFMGSFMVNTNVGKMPLNMEFPKGNSLKDCFEQFDELASKTVEQAQEEANNQSRIVTPGDNDNNIVMP